LKIAKIRKNTQNRKNRKKGLLSKVLYMTLYDDIWPEMDFLGVLEQFCT